MSIFKSKKNKVGMQAKPRARGEITQEYQKNGFQAGRKRCQIVELHEAIERLENEIEEHVLTMRRLDLEFQASPAPEPTPAPIPEPTVTPEVPA